MWLWLLACKTPDDTAAPAPTHFRVAFISDTHVIGPQYTCCSESDDLDNESIQASNDRLAETVRALNLVDPAPEMVVILGDLVHDAHVFDTLEGFDTEETAWSLAADMLSELNMPYHVAWGNHDYDFSCSGENIDRDFTAAIFEKFFELPPYEAVDLFGWKFIVGNSQLGPTFDIGDPRCDGGTGSFGAEQLAWMQAQLAEGLPSVTTSHHYLPVIASAEDDTLGDYEQVLSAAPNVQLTLAGHAHRWLTFNESYAFPHMLLGGTRYDTDNFWIIEFEREGSEYTVLDYDKPDWYTTCADTWVYDQTAEPDPANPAETGSCGS